VATIRTRGRLPHWEAEHAIYFVTFRLADSLPRSVIDEFEAERQSIANAAKLAGRRISATDERRLASKRKDSGEIGRWRGPLLSR
jgi:hypothetical protein